jgi:hypothetical protein
MFPQRLEEELNGTKRLCIQVAHLLLGVLNTNEIEESQHKGIESCKSMRGRALANLTGIFGQSPIAPPVESIFDGPGVAHKLQQTQGSGFFGGKTRDAINVFLWAFEGILHLSASTKDLSDPIPVAGKKILEFCGDVDQTVGEPTMTFVRRGVRAPIQAIGEEVRQRRDANLPARSVASRLQRVGSLLWKRRPAGKNFFACRGHQH